MDAKQINQLIRSLGQTFESLISEGILPNLPLTPLFEDEDNDQLVQRTEPGIEIIFSEMTRRMEQITFAILPTDANEAVYTGELPTPFTHRMNQASVRATLGEPLETQKPFKAMLAAGIGGRDGYRLGASVHPNARVGFLYDHNHQVSRLGFSLIKPT